MSRDDPGAWRERLAALEAEFTAVWAQSGVDDEQAADADEQFAARARAGHLGREWKVLQGRIDLKQTTREAVLSGADDSPEGRAVFALAQRRAGELGEAVAAAAAESDEPDPRDELDALRRRTEERGAALLDLIRTASEDPRRYP